MRTSAQDQGADWPMLAHDLERTGAASMEVAPPYRIVWVRDFYSVDNATSEIIFSHVQPIVVGGLVYVGTSRNNMYALDSDTGAIVWKYSAGGGRGEIMHSPAVVDGVLYFGSTDGRVYALDAQSGSLIWRYEVDRGGFRSSPAVTSDTVYLGATDGFFYALDAADGTLRWRYRTDGPILNSPAIDVQRELVYFGSEDMHAYALNLNNGSLAWRSDELYGASMRNYYPVIADGMVIFRTNPGNAWRALNCGDTVLGRAAGLSIPEACTHLTSGSPGLDMHASGGSGDIENEQNAIRSWLTDAQYADQRSFYALDADTAGGEDAFAEPVPVLWSNGAGNVGEPPVVTGDGRVLLRWRSYYTNIDDDDPAYIFGAIGELNQENGRIIPFNLAEENSYWSTGIFMIGDESGTFSLGGDRLYVFSHADSVGSVTISDHEPAPVLTVRDIPWGVSHSNVFPGQRNLPFGPYNNNYAARFTTFSGGGSANFGHGVTVADGKLFWVAKGMLGAVEHGSSDHGDITPALDGDPVYPPTPSIDVPDPSQLEGYVLDVEEHNPDLMAASDLRDELAAQVEDLISGERYAPLLFFSGKSYGRFFFSDPSEELYVLSISLPYLPSQLQAQVEAYMADILAQYEDDIFRPVNSDGYPVAEGRRREYYQAFNTDSWRACQGSAGCEPRVPPLEERLYYLWAYAFYADQWDAIERNWQVIRDRMHSEIDPDDPESLLDSWYDVSLNRRVASLIAYTRMAQYLGDQEEYQWGLEAATKGLAARIAFEEDHRPVYGEWIGERRHQSYAYFMETNWGEGGFIPRYQGLVPEIGRALSDFAGEDAAIQDSFIETVVPAQYLAGSLSLGRSEQFTNSPTQALEVYLAKALVLQEDGETLRQYLDVPWCLGDLYYIEKLILAVQASEAEPGKLVSPSLPAHGDTLTYTVAVVGTGEPMTVTDAIPTGTTYVSGSAGQSPEGIGILQAGAEEIRWSGVLTLGFPLDITFGVTVDVTEPTAIRNVAVVESGEEGYQLSAVVIANGFKLYLPTVFRHY